MRRFVRERSRMVGGSLGLLAWTAGTVLPSGSIHAATLQGQPVGGSAPIDITVAPAEDESITVMGHRPYVLAPLSGGRAGPAMSGIGPGSRLGPFIVTGGPVNGLVSNGVSAGLALPIAAVKGLEFDAGVTGSRDALSPAGTTGAATVGAGFRLKF